MSERTRLESVPDDLDPIGFWLSEADLSDVVAWRRSGPSRLAAGLQIGGLRSLGHVPADISSMPVETIATVAGQLGLEPGVLDGYQVPDRTLRNHIAGVERHLGLGCDEVRHQILNGRTVQAPSFGR